MGRSIDLTQPLSEEDRAWLYERGDYGALRIADDLAAAASLPPVEETPAEPNEDDEEVESVQYGGWTNAQLRYELSTRGLPGTGNKAELVERLEEDDAVRASESQGEFSEE